MTLEPFLACALEAYLTVWAETGVQPVDESEAVRRTAYRLYERELSRRKSSPSDEGLP